MTDKNRIVAIGLLTQGDIDRLGSGFNRLFPVGDAGDFQGLLDAIDRADCAGTHAEGARGNSSLQRSANVKA